MYRQWSAIAVVPTSVTHKSHLEFYPAGTRLVQSPRNIAGSIVMTMIELRIVRIPHPVGTRNTSKTCV